MKTIAATAACNSNNKVWFILYPIWSNSTSTKRVGSCDRLLPIFKKKVLQNSTIIVDFFLIQIQIPLGSVQPWKKCKIIFLKTKTPDAIVFICFELFLCIISNTKKVPTVAFAENN